MKWVHFSLCGEPASVFCSMFHCIGCNNREKLAGQSFESNLSVQLLVGRGAIPAQISLLLGRLRKEFDWNVWLGNRPLPSLGDSLGARVVLFELSLIVEETSECCGWGQLWSLRSSRPSFSIQFSIDSCASWDDVPPFFQLVSLHCWSFVMSLVSIHSTVQDALATQDLNRPVLKHGPRSLTCVRVFWFLCKPSNLVFLSTREREMKVNHRWEKWGSIVAFVFRLTSLTLHHRLIRIKLFFSRRTLCRNHARAHPLGPERRWTMPA